VDTNGEIIVDNPAVVVPGMPDDFTGQNDYQITLVR